MYFCDYAKHGVPLTFLLIELVINRIAFEWRHVTVSLITITCYCVLYISFCALKGRNVYPFLAVDSWITYVFFLSVCVVIIGLHAALYGISLLKFGDADERSELIKTGKAHPGERVLVVLPARDTKND